MNAADNDRMEALLKTVELIKSGFAGVDKNGQIMDRRQFSAAIPIARSTPLSTPDPRCIQCGEEQHHNDLVNSICKTCKSSK